MPVAHALCSGGHQPEPLPHSRLTATAAFFDYKGPPVGAWVWSRRIHSGGDGSWMTPRSSAWSEARHGCASTTSSITRASPRPARPISTVSSISTAAIRSWFGCSSSSGRFLVYHICGVLEAAQDPSRRDTWLTIGLLKQAMGLFGLASGRHIDDLVARLCEVGFMESRMSEVDRRVRILAPTAALRAHDRDWLVAHFAPLDALYPQHDYGHIMRRDPDFQAVYRRTSIAFLPLGAKLLHAVPEMLHVLNHAGGAMVLAALLQAAMSQADMSQADMTQDNLLHAVVPYGDVGDRFGVSRTQVRKLLRDLEDAGLVRLHARGGRRVEILPRLWSYYDRWLAGGMYGGDLVYLAALRAMRVPADVPLLQQHVGTHAGARDTVRLTV